MRMIASNEDQRLITEGGYLTLETWHRHSDSWWATFRVPLVTLHEAYAEYRDWVEETVDADPLAEY